MAGSLNHPWFVFPAIHQHISYDKTPTKETTKLINCKITKVFSVQRKNYFDYKRIKPKEKDINIQVHFNSKNPKVKKKKKKDPLFTAKRDQKKLHHLHHIISYIIF